MSEIGWQRVLDRNGRKVKERSPNVLVLRVWTLKSFSHDERSFVLVHMHIGSEKDKLVESRRKSGRQEWLCCTVIGI